MKRVQVLIPFTHKGKLYEPSDKEITLPVDVVERLLEINVNMVLVLGDAEPKKRKTKAE